MREGMERLGGKGSFFYTKNSPNLDFLPLVNIEDDEVVGGGLGGVAIGMFLCLFWV